MVLRAFSDTSGMTRCTTARAPEVMGAAERDGVAGGCEAAVDFAGVEEVSIAGLESVADVSLALEGAGAAFLAASGAVAGGVLFEPDLVDATGDDEAALSAALCSIFGTISAARTSVPAAP